MSAPLAQLADAVLMVRPAAFGTNPETAASNAFQATQPASAVDRRAALEEFDRLAAALEAAGVDVLVVEDTTPPAKPDACFPNNWLSLHHDGTVVLYPMLSPLRRLERRADISQLLSARGFRIDRTLDRSAAEREGRFLEGTGSVVFDHRARIAYACESPRTDARLLQELATELGYVAHVFNASGPAGEPVYHTNVVMSLGERFATLCAEAIDDTGQRAALFGRLEAGGRELVLLSREQMGAFAGNMLALATSHGGSVIAMSATARDALTSAQLALLERHGSILAAAVPVIERHGGGSVRCMLAEIFLPRRSAQN